MLTIRENFMVIVVISVFVAAFFSHFTVESLAADQSLQAYQPQVQTQITGQTEENPWASLRQAFNL